MKDRLNDRINDRGHSVGVVSYRKKRLGQNPPLRWKSRWNFTI